MTWSLPYKYPIKNKMNNIRQGCLKSLCGKFSSKMKGGSSFPLPYNYRRIQTETSEFLEWLKKHPTCWQLICPLFSVDIRLDTKHLRLSGEESNSYSLCVPNMLPMDFETINTGTNWGKKKGKQYPNFFCLWEKWVSCLLSYVCHAKRTGGSAKHPSR